MSFIAIVRRLRRSILRKKKSGMTLALIRKTRRRIRSKRRSGNLEHIKKRYPPDNSLPLPSNDALSARDELLLLPSRGSRSGERSCKETPALSRMTKTRQADEENRA